MHRQFNQIFFLNGLDSRWLVQHEEISEEVLTHFQTLFIEPVEDICEVISRIPKFIQNLISTDQNEALMREISYADVEEVVWDLPSNKASGLDGFISEFFKESWKFLGDEILDLVEDSQCSQVNLVGVECHIPKTHPQERCGTGRGQISANFLV